VRATEVAHTPAAATAERGAPSTIVADEPIDAPPGASEAIETASAPSALAPGLLATPHHAAAVEPPTVEPATSEPLAGEPLAGAPLAGASPAGESPAGESPAGDPSAELPSISEFLLAGAQLIEGEERWPIADVGAEVSRLTEGVRVPPAPAAPTASDDVEPASAAPHAPWTDEEQWMDIMPALPSASGRDLEAETAWARAFAEPPAPLVPEPPAGDAALAARALETIAARLRAGELALPAYATGAGEAAALAATLTALLGARRGA
jgi:hypothetical protein